MDLSLAIPAFIAGLLTFLAPCTLPLLPGYLSFISGVEHEKSDDKNARRRIFLNGVWFVVGFSLIFIAFGILIGLLGSALAPYRIWITRLGGVMIILFGLLMLNVLKLPWLNRNIHIQLPPNLKIGTPASSLILGGAFGVGWTPCAGPILGAILLLAATQATALQGGVLLAVFSLGLAIPFLLVAFGMGAASKYIKKYSKHLRWISVIGGIFLIFLGILLLTNKFVLLIAWGFQLLKIFNYEQILEYL